MMKNITNTLLLLISFNAIGQWTSVDIPSNSSFRALKAFNNHIWAGGTQGTILHSKNRGKTWEILQIQGAEKLDFRDIAIINELEVILMSAGLSEEGKARLYVTKDGGKNWELRVNISEAGYFFDCLQWDAKRKKGFLLADPIKQRLNLLSVTKDTLLRVESMHSPTLQDKEAFFAASGSSMIQTRNQIHLIGGGADSIKVYHYNLRNTSWSTSPLSIQGGEAKGYFSIGAKNDKSLWAVGGDYRKLNESSIPIITSQDGGENWTPMSDTPTFYMEKVIWAKPYWVVRGPSRSAAYHEKTKRWKELGNTHFHNIIQLGDVIWGIGAKGQLGYISLSSIDQLFLAEK